MPTTAQILELWNIARVSCGLNRHARMIYCKTHLAPLFPSLSPKALWLAIDIATAP